LTSVAMQIQQWKHAGKRFGLSPGLADIRRAWKLSFGLRLIAAVGPGNVAASKHGGQRDGRMQAAAADFNGLALLHQDWQHRLSRGGRVEQNLLVLGRGAV